MKTTKQMIEVMEAFDKGKKIEWNPAYSDVWVSNPNPAWDWLHNDYRIAEEKEYRSYKNSAERRR